MILSDGNDTRSTHKFEAALHEVQQSGAVVYAIRYPDALGANSSNDDLRRLTDETGGMFFDFNGADYQGIISRIEADLRGRYILGFRPDSTSSGPQRHSLKVEVVRSGENVRARQEYSSP